MTKFKLELTPEAPVSIEDAVVDAIRIAKQLNVKVYFMHCDNHIWARPDSTPEELIDYWQQQEDRKNKHRS